MITILINTTDPNWEGDVTNAPGLTREELESYDPRCDVAFSTKAYMNKQVCEYDVRRILDAVGDEHILLQLDGYESYLNALDKVDVDGHINEAVNPGDYTDVSSTIDQELGQFIKIDFNTSFKKDFNARPDAWQLGKVSAKERRILFTTWTCDAVEKLMTRRDIIRRAFRGTGVGIDSEGKMKDHIIFPGFASYVPPEKDEEHIVGDLTEKEIKDLEKQEDKVQKQIKKRKQQAKDNKLRERAKKRAKNM